MNFIRPFLVAVAIGAFAAAPGSAKSDADDMSATAAGFYSAYKSLPADGVPDAAGRTKLEPFISQTLEKLLSDAAAAEAAFAQGTKGQSPPLLEGDVFTSLFEGATSFKIGTCKSEGRKGTCAAELTYASPNQKPVVWTDTVYLVQTDAGWRVDDIGYGGSWDFGNKGRLSETLKFAIANANG
ncbi:MAG: hypothetical protein HY243_18140 [Proteobacteria bacterium]|nr:hypothetical protein [Pseudomonadota bacterium]